MKSVKFLGILQVIAAGTGFGFIGVFSRLAFKTGMTIGELLFLRFTIAALVLWFILLVFRRSLIVLPVRQILVSFLLGLLGYAVFSTLYVQAIKGIPIALAAMLLFTFPLFVSLGEFLFFGEKLSGTKWGTLFTALLGLAILLQADFNNNNYDAIFSALAASLTYSVYVLVSGRVQRKVPPLSSSLYVITAAAIGLYGFHRPEVPRIAQFTSEQWWIVGGMGVVCSIGPLTLFLAGLQKMTSSEASVLVMIEPVVAAISAWWVLGEKLSPLQILGGVIVIQSIALHFYDPKNRGPARASVGND